MRTSHLVLLAALWPSAGAAQDFVAPPPPPLPVETAALPPPPPPLEVDTGWASAPAPEKAKPAGEKAEACDGSGSITAPPPPPVGFGFAGGTPALGELTRPPAPGIDVGLGLDVVDEELLLDTKASARFELGPVRFGLQAPLRWKIYGFDDGKATFELRKQDWDEVDDVFKIVRYVEYGSPRETVYARLGELAGATMGHGSIVSWYYNSVEVDHWQTGARFDVNLAPGGLESMLQSISSPRLVGGRLHVRPWWFVDRCSWLAKLSVGFSTYVDAAAPFTLAGATVDEHERLAAPNTRAVAVYGFDVDYPLVVSRWFDLTPYLDVNGITGEGAGFHGGAIVGLHPGRFDVQARLEYRHVGAQYLPAYFDSLYEVQRLQFKPGVTKLQWLDGRANASARNGAYGEVIVSVEKAFSLLVAYEDYDGPSDSSLQLRVMLPELFGFRLGAWYVKRDFEGWDGFVDRDNALGVFELRYQITSLLSVVGQLSRQWKVRADRTYQTSDAASVGLNLGWTF